MQNVVRSVVIEQGEPQPSSEGRTSGEPPLIDRPPRLLRVRLWQAIAGMSVAIAIASLIVISELAGSLARRTNYVNRRVAALNATVRTLRRQTAAEQRKLGSERERASEGEVFEKILFAPDLRTIKLAAPGEKDKEKDKSIALSGGPDLPSGTLAMSESAAGAMLEATGLKPTGPFQVYRIWWMPKRGAPIWAADFLVADDGLATVPLDLPSGREKRLSLIVTLEDESYSDAPAGPIALKAESSPLPGSAQSARKSRH
ncbi:MAG TPA: anti-sigma factor [Candidatus Binatus sp.]|nr:anti-sigma factor [Candidatus Binatus sp.]HKN14221.1 anti-sigma factor [Candidatus Binatus sp.]